MVMVLKLGQMVQNTRAHMLMERNTERENSFGLMGLDMRENLTITTSMELECTNGLMEDSMMENG